MYLDSFSWIKDTFKVQLAPKLRTQKMLYDQLIGPEYFSLSPSNFREYVTELLSPDKITLNSIYLDLDFKSMSALDEDREISKGSTVNAKLTMHGVDSNKKKFNVKLRAKGDRNIHRKDFESMSFKVDIKGDDRLFGFEEFSIQRPIIRNYSIEILIQEFMKTNDVLTVSTVPVKLFVNNEYFGIYHVEEGFSKEILEKNNRKDGPIAGIDESLSTIFPDMQLDYYSINKWIANREELITEMNNKIIHTMVNYKKDNFDLCLNFDCSIWGKFFAITDFFGAQHGAVPKSVKLYFNPSTGYIEPIFFDGHALNYVNLVNQLSFDSIKSNFEGTWYSSHIEWFRLFFNDRNEIFMTAYYNMLNEIISTKGREGILSIFEKKIKPINQLYYKSFAKSDGVWGSAFLPYYFDYQYIINRFNLIEKRLNSIYLYKQSIKKNKDETINNSFSLNDIHSLNDYSIKKINNLKLTNNKIKITENTLLFLTGKTFIKNVTFNGPIMIVQLDGEFSAENLKILNPKVHDIKTRNWSGAVNLINSNNTLNNLLINGVEGEDALNLVNSNSLITNITIENTFSDALDIDFGKLVFNEIKCNNIKNDCFDSSDASIEGEIILGTNVQDKVISLGEASKLKLKKLSSNESEIGIVVKDGSYAEIDNVFFSNTKLNIAAYTKKNMFVNDNFISINEYISMDENPIDLLSDNTIYKLSGIEASGNIKSIKIESLLYGNQYGAATVK